MIIRILVLILNGIFGLSYQVSDLNFELAIAIYLIISWDLT